jgi:hypothetical protein
VTYNAGERKDVRKAEKASRLADNLRGAFVRNVMDSIEGRRWVWDLLSRCHLFQTPMTDSDRWTAFACGEMNVGQQIVADIMTYCPDSYIRMQREANERRIANLNDDNDNDTSGSTEHSGSTDPGRDVEGPDSTADVTDGDEDRTYN